MPMRAMTSTWVGWLILLGAAGIVRAAPGRAHGSDPAVVATLGAGQVRFVAPSSVHRIRLEVFDADQAKVFDSGLQAGNVLDWGFRDQEAQPLPGGTFGCVLTLREISGRVARRRGLLVREGAGATWQEATLVGEGEPGDLVEASRSGAGRDTTLLAHDATGGLLASGSGGLSFRLGDFLAGVDVERMRLSDEGDLGIGVSAPQSRLDVAGEIRTSEGIRFPDGTLQTTAAMPSASAIGAKDLVPVAAAAADGSGTPGFLAKWATPTFLGDSTIVEVGGNVGIGTSSPGGALDLQRASAGDILQRFWNTGSGGAKLRYVAGDGATSQLQFTDVDDWLAAIAVGEGAGLQLRVRGTDPGSNSEFGLASSSRMTIARTGWVGIGTTNPTAALQVKSGVGDEGSIRVGGDGQNANGKTIHFGATAVIGEFGAYNRLNYTAGEHRFWLGNVIPGEDALKSLGTSTQRWSAVWAADGTINTSDARLKKDVADLGYGLREVLRLRPVTYRWKDRPEDRQHLGMIAQEVRDVLPEVVVTGADADAPLGMSYAELVPVLVKAIQEQQRGIAALAAENAALRARIEAVERSTTEPALTRGGAPRSD
jgi:hypothetical protein